LLAGAKVALAQALRHAGVKVSVRARKRPAAVRAAVGACLEAGLGLGEHLAAVGITESEMLDGAFDSYGESAHLTLAQAAKRRAAILASEGYDPSIDTVSDVTIGAGVGFLVAALVAVARNTLMDGALPTPAVGEVSGAVSPGIIGNAMRLTEGAASMVGAASPDDVPTLIPEPDAPSVADAIAADAGVPVDYTWVWGYYADPWRPFEPHEDLGASEFTTSDPWTDPDLASDVEWTEGDLYHPGDHDGCSCEWVETLGLADYADTPIDIPDPGSEAMSVAFPDSALADNYAST
jgi:hypothetical protein